MFVFLFSQYDLWSEKFSPNRSFLKILRTIPMGVTITKKIANITIGGTTFPRRFPSFIHKRLKGFSNTGLRNDKINNIADTINQGSLIWLPSRTGHSEIIKNTTENTIPKLFSEDFFISYFL